MKATILSVLGSLRFLTSVKYVLPSNSDWMSIVIGPFSGRNRIAVWPDWMARLNSQRHYAMLADWAEQSKIADDLLPLPSELKELTLMPYREQDQFAFEGQR